MSKQKNNEKQTRINGKKPTREQRKIIDAAGLDTYEFLVQQHTSTKIRLISKDTGEVVEIPT